MFELFKKNRDEKSNKNCDVCGKTYHDMIKHKDKHVCKECYLDIFNDSKDTK